MDMPVQTSTQGSARIHCGSGLRAYTWRIWRLSSRERRRQRRGECLQEPPVSASARGRDAARSTWRAPKCTCVRLSETLYALFAVDDGAEGREALDEVLGRNRRRQVPDVHALDGGLGRERSSRCHQNSSGRLWQLRRCVVGVSWSTTLSSTRNLGQNPKTCENVDTKTGYGFLIA